MNGSDFSDDVTVFLKMITEGGGVGLCDALNNAFVVYVVFDLEGGWRMECVVAE